MGTPVFCKPPTDNLKIASLFSLGLQVLKHLGIRSEKTVVCIELGT